MELETQRLRIDPFSKNDIEHWANIEADARVRKYIDGKPLTAEDAERYILRNIKSYKDNGFGRYAVRLLKDNTLIGMCGFLEEPLRHRFWISLRACLLAKRLCNRSSWRPRRLWSPSLKDATYCCLGSSREQRLNACAQETKL